MKDLRKAKATQKDIGPFDVEIRKIYKPVFIIFLDIVIFISMLLVVLLLIWN